MDSSPPPPPAQPPGWYHDGVAHRWWDGQAWGPYAPAPGVNSDDKTFSTLSHLGVVVGGFILPLVFYLISDDRQRPETRWHAREALNFQLTFLATYIASFALMFVGIGIGSAINSGLGVGLGFGLFFILIIAAVIANFVFSIIGALRANQGERWKYPISFRFIKE